MSPDGDLLTQPVANQLSLKQNLILLCGHYKGVDERVREHLVTRELSIGDYVLSGGELAAAVVADGDPPYSRCLVGRDFCANGFLPGWPSCAAGLHAARGIPGLEGAGGIDFGS